MNIYKYILKENGKGVMMPKGAIILHAAAQREEPAIWALVDPLAPLERRDFEVHGTGFPIDTLHGKEYIGTALIMEGAMAVHVFEVKEDA